MKRIAFLTAILALAISAQLAVAARPVARWDVVPDQIITEPFNVGVVAFHLEGVQVEFRVDGNLLATATEPAYNERTGVWEYFCTLDPSQYTDGPLSIDARVICLSGDSVEDPDYDLDTITLYANAEGMLGSTVEKWVDSAGGSDSNDGSEAAPYLTLVKAVKNTPAGGSIYLFPGNYSPDALGGGSTRAYWTLIRPADGVSRDEVVLGTGRPSTERLHWQDVTFKREFTGSYGSLLVGNNGKERTWVDGCHFENLSGRWGGSLEYFGNKYIAYVTGGSSSNMANGPGASLIRDHNVYTLKSDAWSGGGKLVVNSAVYDIDAGSTGAHPDFHQSYTTAPNFVQNAILYNVRGYDGDCQGLFGVRLANSAFVNVLFERIPDTVAYSQYSGPMENVLYAHVTLIHQNWLWRGSGTSVYDPTDVNLVNCIFNSMGFAEDAAPDPELVIDTNHFSGNAQGTNYTTGAHAYVSPDDKDYRLLAESPAAGTGMYMQCVPADIDGNLYDTETPNKGCYAGTFSANKPGDANGDGEVDLDDFIILKQNYGTTGASWDQGDFNGDGTVDLDDFIILKQNYGS